MPFLRRFLDHIRPTHDPLAAYAGDSNVAALLQVALDESVHFDVRRIMQETIVRRVGIFSYKESLVPNKSLFTGEGLGITSPGYWGAVLAEIAQDIRQAKKARPEAVGAYKRVSITATDHVSTFPKDLRSTRILLAQRILVAVPRHVS